jgi:hypothetical protein
MKVGKQIIIIFITVSRVGIAMSNIILELEPYHHGPPRSDHDVQYGKISYCNKGRRLTKDGAAGDIVPEP